MTDEERVQEIKARCAAAETECLRISRNGDIDFVRASVSAEIDPDIPYLLEQLAAAQAENERTVRHAGAFFNVRGTVAAGTNRQKEQATMTTIEQRDIQKQALSGLQVALSECVRAGLKVEIGAFFDRPDPTVMIVISPVREDAGWLLLTETKMQL